MLVEFPGRRWYLQFDRPDTYLSTEPSELCPLASADAVTDGIAIAKQMCDPKLGGELLPLWAIVEPLEGFHQRVTPLRLVGQGKCCGEGVRAQDNPKRVGGEQPFAHICKNQHIEGCRQELQERDGNHRPVGRWHQEMPKVAFTEATQPSRVLVAMARITTDGNMQGGRGFQLVPAKC
eukprot:7391661-Prymnesium_polylepis.2